MRIKYLFTILLLAACNGLFSQKSPEILNHYQNEYQTFKEFLNYSQKVKGDTNINVLFYYIDIEIGVYAPWVEGDVSILFEPVVANLNTVSINLNSSLNVDAISAPAESFYQDNDLIVITLDGDYNPGDQLEITVSYHGIPVLAGGYKGMRYESHGNGEPIIATLSTPYLAHYWYPCKDGPEDKPDSMYMDITLPDEVINGQELMGISNGVLENVIDNGDTKTFQWRHRYPIVTYYIMAAVSNYVHFQEQFNGTGGETFPLEYYVFQENLASAQNGVSQLPDAIQFFSDIFGTYPFSEEKYGMTQLGFYGAIENQTNTIQNNLSASWFMTSVHELAHMWFGDMITLADWHHCWLNEGFATYSEALWDEHEAGFDAYKQNMQTNEYWNGGTLYLQNAADTFNTFQSIYYTKGAYTVHMLRGVLGDNMFFDALKDYTQNPDFAYKNASTYDLQQSFENSSGMDLDFFFEQWIYDEYWPFYHYNYAQGANNNLSVVIYQAQEGLYGYRPVFEMPVRIYVSFTDNSDTTVIAWNDQQTQQFEFDLNKEVNDVQIDPDKWILRKTMYQPSIPVGITRQSGADLITVFPNPFSDRLTIIFPGVVQVDKPIKIFNGQGQLVQEKVLRSGTSMMEWDGTDFGGDKLKPGIYYLEISSVEFTGLRKIILSR
ncbi:MAG: T9SS type A sorting domain-containing protein [Bacteroidales bacterium]|nr:T9SS type A sorting domain-containing protein [Bacteroidales bacterium]